MVAAATQNTGTRFYETSTTQVFPLGYMADDEDGRTWQYIKAGEALVIYDYVNIPATYIGIQSVNSEFASMPAMMGCAQVAFASGDYGWVVRQGLHTGNIVASVSSAGAKMYTSATAGHLTDSSSTTRLVNGLVNIGTTAGAAAGISMNATCQMTVARA